MVCPATSFPVVTITAGLLIESERSLYGHRHRPTIQRLSSAFKRYSIGKESPGWDFRRRWSMSWFETFAREYAAYGYPVLFAGVLLENAGIPVPGETAVLVAGFLASPAGGGHFHVLLVVLTTLVAAVLGDNIG